MPSSVLSQRTSKAHPLARLPGEWETWFQERGEPAFRGRQVFQWLHQRGEFRPEHMTNLSRSVRTALQEEGVACPFVVEQVRRANDGTRKLLLRLDEGSLLECVLIPMTESADVDVALGEESEDATSDEETKELPVDQRVTLCISTQVGCAMGCRFCASGQAGLKRGLGAAEIVAQVLVARHYLDEGERLRNLVFMGMGEPLHHYDATRQAIELIVHPDGIGMSPRRITVSTVGLVPGIERLGRDFGGKLGLAVSLHAPDNETRDLIMPMNRRYDVEQLVEALRRYPLPKRRRITIEYTLIDGINDTTEHAERLARLLSGLRVKVNLIPMNPIDAASFRAPSPTSVESFRSVLAAERVSCSVRQRRGDDVDAACGQLALRTSLVSAESLVGAG